jgi:hypothetical protein
VGANSPAEALTMVPAFRETSNFAQLRNLKRDNSKLRTMISLGGWTLSSPFFSIARDAQKRADFAKSAVYVMARYGFDGIDIDWEYPGGGGLEQSAMANPASDGANFLLLLQALRDELDRQEAKDARGYYLSIAGPGGDEKIANFDPAAVAGIVERCVRAGVPLVVATTGLGPADHQAIAAASQRIPVLQSPSMSLAVNVAMDLVRQAAETLARVGGRAARPAGSPALVADDGGQR